MTRQLAIGLDADGVLLNYNLAWGAIWSEAYGQEPTCVEPRAYHATTYWGLPTPEKEHPFWSLFDQKGWKNMPAMRGAVLACRRLAAAGHRLVCVTSMPTHRQEDRLTNLQALGFPIHEVVATGNGIGDGSNPKRTAIEKIGLDWFVDDELRKLRDLGDVKCVLVDPGHPDSPNQGENDEFLSHRVRNLQEFADLILGPMGQSPCLGVCQLDTQETCVGCGRSVDEIARWRSMGQEERGRIWARLRGE